MSDFHEQAEREVDKIANADINCIAIYCFAVSQRERVLTQDRRIVELEAELELQKGANRAQDERERKAAERLGMVHNCDWPDDVAQRVLELARGIVDEYSPCRFDYVFPNIQWCLTHNTKRCGQAALFEKAEALLAAQKAKTS